MEKDLRDIIGVTTFVPEMVSSRILEISSNATLNDGSALMSGTLSYNGTDADLIDIFWEFYNNFNGEANYLLIILYVPVMALAVIANVLVIAVVFKYHYMRSICNYFVVNLSVADLLVTTICMPYLLVRRSAFVTVTNYFVVNLSVADLLVTTICMPVAVSQAISIIWIHGEVMCKLSAYLQGVAVAASVFTITAMSIDRYLAIRSPIAFRRVFNRRSTVLVIVALWLVALSVFAPILKAMSLQSPGGEFVDITFHGPWRNVRNSSRNFADDRRMPPAFYICSEDFKPLGIRANLFGTACFILVYAVPGFVVILAYSMMGRTLCARKPPFDCDSVEGSASSQQSFRLVRERRRIAWILLLLAVLFALCWLPYNVLRLLVDLGAVEQSKPMNDALSYCLFLGHANSALNPVVYCFMTRNFRRSVVEILCRGPHALARRKPRRKSAQGTAVVEDACAGSSLTGIGGTRKKLRQRNMQTGFGCSTPGGGQRPILDLRRTTTSTTGYDSFHSRYSPHKRCYMLKNVRAVRQAPSNSITNEKKTLESRNENETSQRRGSTLITTDER